MGDDFSDDDNEFDIGEEYDGHSIHDEHPSLEIVGVICVCICGTHFVACIGCLLNGKIEVCPDCDAKLMKAHSN